MQLIPKEPENNLRISCTVISTATAWAYFPWTDQYVFWGKKNRKENLVWKKTFLFTGQSVSTLGLCCFACLFLCDGENHGA